MCIHMMSTPKCVTRIVTRSRTRTPTTETGVLADVSAGRSAGRPGRGSPCGSHATAQRTGLVGRASSARVARAREWSRRPLRAPCMGAQPAR